MSDKKLKSNLGFIVTNMNGEIVLDICLKFIRHLYPDSPIIVVDDHSFNDKTSVVKKYNADMIFHTIDYDYMNFKNQRLEHNIQQGYQYLIDNYPNVDIVIQLDNDCFILKKDIDKFAEKIFEENENSLVIGEEICYNTSTKSNHAEIIVDKIEGIHFSRLGTMFFILNVKLMKQKELKFFDYATHYYYFAKDDGSCFYNYYIKEKGNNMVDMRNVFSFYKHSVFGSGLHNIHSEYFFHIGGFTRRSRLQLLSFDLTTKKMYIERAERINEFLKDTAGEIDLEYNDEFLGVLDMDFILNFQHMEISKNIQRLHALKQKEDNKKTTKACSEISNV